MKRATLFCLFLLLASGQVCRAQSVHIRVLSRFHPTQLEVRAEGSSPVYFVVGGEGFYVEPRAADSVVRIAIEGDGVRVSIHGRELHAGEMRVANLMSPAEFQLSVSGKVSRRYKGTLSITVRRGELAPVVNMDLEIATASAVQDESEPGTPLEALKAQAVVTRSYYFAARGRHADDEFCDLTHCQVLRELPPLESPATRAAAETYGLVLEYQEKPFAAMFTRSCGGHTRTPFDTGQPINGYPYYSVACDYCHTTPYRWTRKLSAEDAALAVKGESGRLAVNRRLGWNTVPSNSFTTHKAGAEVVLEGAGQGHGIGLCQLGAAAMAAGGANFREILSHYFPNTNLQLFRYSTP